MKRLLVCLCIVYPVLVSQIAAQGQLGQVVSGFVPPDAELVEFRTYDKVRKVFEPGQPAILRGSIVSPDSENIVFAYMTKPSGALDKILFVAMLHKTSSGYVKVFDRAFYGKVLLSGNALRLVHLSGNGPVAIAVFAGTGASLGGRLFLFRWVEIDGLKNIMPEEVGGHRVRFEERKDGLIVVLSNERYADQKDAPPPTKYRWNGEKIVRTN